MIMEKKIKVSPEIKKLIIKERNNKNLSGIELSKAMGKSDAWISSLENGRTKTITSTDLIAIIKLLLNISEEDADIYIQQELEKLRKEKEEKKVDQYTIEKNFVNKTEFNKITKNIIEGFDLAFENVPEYTFKSIAALRKNLHSDIGFTLGFLSIPLYLFEDIDTELKQKLFNEIGDIINKYIDEYLPKEESSEEN